LRPHVLSRRTHKWLALIVAVQAVIWTMSGLYMTAVHIDIIQGDHFIRAAKPKPVGASQIVSPMAAIAGAGGGETVRLDWPLDRPVYVVRSESGERLVDARSARKASAAIEGASPPRRRALVHGLREAGPADADQ
jgi:hypothetical protein